MPSLGSRHGDDESVLSVTRGRARRPMLCAGARRDILRFGTLGQDTDNQQSSGKVKAGQIWSKNKDELTKQLGELKTELGQLRIQKITSSGAKLNKMYEFSSPDVLGVPFGEGAFSDIEGALTSNVFPSKQPRSPQVDRARPDRHQREATGPAAPLLQEQEVSAAGPETEADPRHPPPSLPQGRLAEAREGQEAPAALPPTDLCRKGAPPSTPLRSQYNHSAIRVWFIRHWSLTLTSPGCLIVFRGRR